MFKALGKNLFKNSKKSKKKYDTIKVIQKKQIDVGNVRIDVEFKNIKNINLKVHNPSGKVSISAPENADMKYLQQFAVSKLDWIQKHQEKISIHSPKYQKEFITGENHYFLGKVYTLEVIESHCKSKIQLDSDRIIMIIPFGTICEQKQKYLDEWYRFQLKMLLPDLISKWEKVIKVKINEFGVKKMKTKWGTCNRTAKRIWLNLDLVKKPVEVIEYILVHELVHLLERYHNKRFYGFLSQFLPDWKILKEELNKYN